MFTKIKHLAVLALLLTFFVIDARASVFVYNSDHPYHCNGSTISCDSSGGWCIEDGSGYDCEGVNGRDHTSNCSGTYLSHGFAPDGTLAYESMGSYCPTNCICGQQSGNNAICGGNNCMHVKRCFDCQNLSISTNLVVGDTISISATLNDINDEIESVIFYYASSSISNADSCNLSNWINLGTDNNGADGWSVEWQPTTTGAYKFIARPSTTLGYPSEKWSCVGNHPAISSCANQNPCSACYEERNITNPTQTPTPTPPYIQGHVYEDTTAAAVGGNKYCVGTSTNSLDTSVTTFNITTNPAARNNSITIDGYTFSIATNNTNLYSISLDLTNSDPSKTYHCACLQDTNDPTICRYVDIEASASIDFFVKNYNLAFSGWWQTYGGNVLARNNITSTIPDTHPDEPYLIRQWLDHTDSYINNSDGVTFLNGSLELNSQNSRQSGGNDDNYYVDNYSFPEKEDFNYFSKNIIADLITDSIDNTISLEGTITNNNGTFFYYKKGDLVIAKTKKNKPALKVKQNQKIVILVEGNVTIQDSVTFTDSDHEIIDVADNDGFFALISSGNITITNSVGHPTSAIPSEPKNKANIEGLYIADGLLTISDDGNPDVQDHQFIGGGTFVGWQRISLNRTFDDDKTGAYDNINHPAQVFVHRPDFIVSAPNEMKKFHQHWSEIAPEKTN